MITRTSKFNGIRKTIHGTIKDMKTVIVKNDIQVFQQPNQQESNTLLIVAAIICLIIPPLLPIFLLYLGCKYAPNAMVGLVILTIILSACAGGMFYYAIYQEQIQQQKTQQEQQRLAVEIAKAEKQKQEKEAEQTKQKQAEEDERVRQWRKWADKKAAEQELEVKRQEREEKARQKAEEDRIWHTWAIKTDKIEAKFMGMVGKRITLKTREGDKLIVSFDDLNPEDKYWIYHH